VLEKKGAIFARGHEHCGDLRASTVVPTWKLGDVHIAEGEGDMPGGNRGTTILTLGYDTIQGKYVGTFIGSMMTYQWVYEGELDEDERVLILDTMGPDFTEQGIGSKLVPYQDRMEFIDDDHRVLTSHRKGSDGRWQPFVEIHYYRKSNGGKASRR
jgi:hypothetical protein